MTIVDADAPEEIRWHGKWVIAKQRGRWEYVGRARNIRAAVILPLDGPPEAREVVLVEQYRVPVGGRCLELPAGLIGDDAGGEGEAAMDAAKRELEEETGYVAREWADLGEYWSSPGLVSESFTLLRAYGLKKVGAGGGDADENIVVHRVKVADLNDFVSARRAEGTAIDIRLLIMLGAGILQDNIVAK